MVNHLQTLTWTLSEHYCAKLDSTFVSVITCLNLKVIKLKTSFNDLDSDLIPTAFPCQWQIMVIENQFRRKLCNAIVVCGLHFNIQVLWLEIKAACVSPIATLKDNSRNDTSFVWNIWLLFLLIKLTYIFPHLADLRSIKRQSLKEHK